MVGANRGARLCHGRLIRPAGLHLPLLGGKRSCRRYVRFLVPGTLRLTLVSGPEHYGTYHIYNGVNQWMRGSPQSVPGNDRPSVECVSLGTRMHRFSESDGPQPLSYHGEFFSEKIGGCESAPGAL